MKNIGIFIIIFTVITGSALFLFMTNQKPATSNKSAETGSAILNEISPTESASMKTNRYVEYSTETFADNVDKKRVLFFHAVWCPTCKVANEAFLKDQSEIPEDVLLLKTDYDTEKTLKQKYGITYQHTFVQVDTSGNQIAKWNGGDIEALRANIK